MFDIRVVPGMSLPDDLTARFSLYDMKNAVLRGPDNTDGFDYWYGYVLACDDPVLCKAPYVAAKNVFFPEDKEIEAVEYYLEHFVWGVGKPWACG